MASNMLSPGVQVTEMDFSDYVTEASTSVIGLVGGARKGSLDPTLVTSVAEAIKKYGDPTMKDYGIYSLLAALSNADQVYYKRVVKLASKASAGDPDVDKLVFYSLTEDSKFNDTKITVTGTEAKFSVTVELGDTSETYADLTLATAPTSINGKSKLVTIEINNSGKFNASVMKMSGGAIGAAYATTPSSNPIVFTSKTYDSTLNGCSVKLSTPDFLGNFIMRLVDKKGNVLEELNNLSTDPTDDRFIETYITNGSAYLNCEYNEADESTITDKSYELSGGTDGIDGLSRTEIIDGLDAYSNPETIDIDILAVPGWSDAAVLAKGIKVAEERQDCFFLIDPPFGLTAQQVADWSNCQGAYIQPGVTAFDTSYAGIYWPWVQIYDTYTSQYIWLPPSGYVASQIAYSDSISEPWFAPAGITRGKLTTPVGIEYSPTKGERDLLYGNRNVVNSLINYKGSGLVIWGQKTTQRKSSSLDRVNVRRLVNYLKKIIAASTAYYVFDPNDEYSWQKWVDMVEPRLAAIKSKRGVYEYKIIMDSTTVTEDDINNNRMPGTIMFKPTKTAEFIPLSFMIMPYGASFDEKEL